MAISFGADDVDEVMTSIHTTPLVDVSSDWPGRTGVSP